MSKGKVITKRKLGEMINMRDFATVLALIILSVIIAVIEPIFLSRDNLINVVNQSTINAIIAAGMTFVILTGGIDLSAGSILAFAGVVMASSLTAGHPIAISILICLLIGTVCGLINGILVTKGKLPPFIATLGMMSIARGFALVYTQGRPITGFDPAFRFFGTGTIGIFPTQVVMVLIIYAVVYYVLKYTKLGRYTYAMGGNEEATRLSGINVTKFKIIIYGISGFMCGIASIVLTARLNSAQPTAGISYELDAIAAVVIGGTNQSGGEGKIQGTLVGALIIGVLRNGLNLLDVSAYLQQVALGIVIVGAVLIDKNWNSK